MSELSVPDEMRTVRRGERPVYETEWITVSLADVETPDGRRFDHHVVRMKPIAIAVLVDRPASTVLMLRRHRWVTDEVGFELLGGLVEPEEDPAHTAAREAEEESGWRPTGDPIHLPSFQPLPGMVDATTDIYMWESFEHIGDPTDTEEAGDLCWVPLSEIPKHITSRNVLGAGTLIALLQLIARDCGIDTTQASA